MRTLNFGALAGVGIFAALAPAHAGVAPSEIVEMRVSWSGGTWSTSVDPNAFTNANYNPETGVYRFNGGWSQANLGFQIEARPGDGRGPGFSFVNASYSFTNTTGATDNFQVTILSASQAFNAPVRASGSVSGSLGSGGPPGDLATLSNVGGNPLYRALIDGTSVRSLVTSPFSFSTTFPATVPFGPANFGIPTGELLNETVAAQIGVVHTFRLTAGDSVTFSSTFTVTPTPGAAALFGVAGLAAFRRRR